MFDNMDERYASYLLKYYDTSELGFGGLYYVDVFAKEDRRSTMSRSGLGETKEGSFSLMGTWAYYNRGS